jgi:hypothetical protein
MTSVVSTVIRTSNSGVAISHPPSRTTNFCPRTGRAVAQSRTEAQPVIRTLRNHYTRARDIEAAYRRAGGRDLPHATRLPVPATTRIPTTLGLIWLYILVAGAPPSAIRAGVVATLVFAAGLLGRQVAPVHYTN